AGGPEAKAFCGAVMLNEYCPGVLGVPEKLPSLFKVKPVGKEPPFRLNVYGPVPPVAVTVGQARPTVQSGSADRLIEITDATCTAVPLLTLLVVTTALRAPSEVGWVLKVTVNCVADAAVTVPTAPSLKETEFLAAVESKPKPLMISVLELAICTVLI